MSQVDQMLSNSRDSVTQMKVFLIQNWIWLSLGSIDLHRCQYFHEFWQKCSWQNGYEWQNIHELNFCSLGGWITASRWCNEMIILTCIGVNQWFLFSYLLNSDSLEKNGLITSPIKDCTWNMGLSNWFPEPQEGSMPVLTMTLLRIGVLFVSLCFCYHYDNLGYF